MVSYVIALVSVLVVSTGCNDRDRGRGPMGDSSMTVDSSTLPDGGPADTSATGDSSTAPDTSVIGDGGSMACSFDVKLEGLPTSPACEDTWMESGATLAFVNTTTDDCSAGRCDYMTDPMSDALWLYPGRLEVRLQSATCTSTTVEVDVDDFCGAGCTKAFAYSTGVEVARAENVGSGPETLVLTGAGIDMVAVSSCEGMVNELRFR